MVDNIELCKQRYKDIATLIEDDESAKELLNDLNQSVTRYVSTVTYIRALMITISNNGEGDGTPGSKQRIIENMDSSRRASHEALIDSLNSFNRYLLKNKNNVPLGGIYTLDTHTINDRERIGDWAGYYLIALTQLNSGE